MVATTREMSIHIHVLSERLPPDLVLLFHDKVAFVVHAAIVCEFSDVIWNAWNCEPGVRTMEWCGKLLPAIDFRTIEINLDATHLMLQWMYRQHIEPTPTQMLDILEVADALGVPSARGWLADTTALMLAPMSELIRSSSHSTQHGFQFYRDACAVLELYEKLDVHAAGKRATLADNLRKHFGRLGSSLTGDLLAEIDHMIVKHPVLRKVLFY